jgi:hypothetical protein
MSREIYYVHSKVLCRRCDVRGIIYYEHSRAWCTRSILSFNLAVKSCLGLFLGCFWAGFQAVFRGLFGKSVCFRLIARLLIYDSVWYRLSALNLPHLIHCGWRSF